jgi:hypothetical protein
VIVKINPRDVVSIPSDYNDAKGRACRYEVIGEVGNNPDDGVEFTRPVQTNANSVQTPDTWDWDADGVEEFDDFVDDSYDYDADGDVDLVELDITTEPKQGSGMFFRGYHDGYNTRKFDPQANTPTGTKFYTDGYEKGEHDSAWANDPQYVYVPDTPSGWTRHADGKVSPPPGTVFTAQTADAKASAPAAWPFPKV